MNSSIFNKINQYLLERYPNVWNTKIVWMLLISFVIHVFFYIGGYLTFINPISLQQYLSDHRMTTNNGVMLYSIGISCILLVLWIVNLFKNNAFKNFYPTSNFKIFLSFWYFLIIFFAGTTFHLSYVLGYKTYLNKTYPKAALDADIITTAKAEPFLFTQLNDYTLDQRRYPSPFDTLNRNVYDSKSNAKFSGPITYSFQRWYQFYTTYQLKTNIYQANYQELLDSSLKMEQGEKDTVFLTMLDKVIDVTNQVDTGLSIYNYSNSKFNLFNHYETDIDALSIGYQIDTNNNKIVTVRKHTYDLLKTNNKAGIIASMQNFLDISKKYKFKTNLTVDNWSKIVFNNPNFFVDSFIADKNEYDTYYATEEYAPVTTAPTIYDTTSNDALERFDELYFKKRLTNKYINVSAIANTFENIYSLKQWDRAYEIILFSAWVAFGLALLLFAFRITSLKALIFTGVTAGLIGITIGIVGVLGLANSSSGLFLKYYILIIFLLILLVPIFFKDSINKKIKAVTLNLTLIFMVPFIILILSIIDTHQSLFYESKYGFNYDTSKYLTVFDQVSDTALGWILLIFGILFTLFYTFKIKKWKALEEG